MAQINLSFCDFVDSFRARAVETPSGAERTKLDDLCDCLESVGCNPVRAGDLLPDLADLQRKLDSCETKMTQDVCLTYRTKLNQVVAGCKSD